VVSPKSILCQRTKAVGICILLLAVVDVARLISDARTIDAVFFVECEVIIQVDVLPQHPVDKLPLRSSAK
jgi:hypothetical protein